jgi:hypothetical protein
MNIEIRKRQLHRMHIMQSGEFIHPVDYTIFVIVQNGKRIDAFLKKRNTQRVVRRMKKEASV